MRKVNGFTLIELMITVAIIGILSAIALPSYSSYVMRGKIPDATAGLATKRVQMEQFFQDNRTYENSPVCNADTTTSKFFDFSCSVAGTANAYTLQAVGKGTMDGFIYTVDQSNNKATTAAPSDWTTTTGCWATSKSGC